MEAGNRTAAEVLKAPYSRVLMPDAETGTYAAKITEFPGCVAQGDTPEEAFRNLEAAAESWIEELMAMGQRVPEPSAFNQYSGRIALRLPKSLHRNAAQLAEREGTSLNQFLVSAIAERVGAGSFYAKMNRMLEERATESIVQPAVNITFQTLPGGSWYAHRSGMPVTLVGLNFQEGKTDTTRTKGHPLVVAGMSAEASEDG
jgi:predicted RNase H-like HicB family nuclease